MNQCEAELRAAPLPLAAVFKHRQVFQRVCAQDSSPSLTCCASRLHFLALCSLGSAGERWARSRSRKVFDESLLVSQRRDDGVSAGEKHSGRANHTCGARRLFLDSPSEDVAAFFFFPFSCQLRVVDAREVSSEAPQILDLNMHPPAADVVRGEL